jgi:CRISPR-associated protein Csb2
MFSIAIRYLNGWAMAAADGPKKQQPEWPPHPGRTFMAFSAAWFETGEDPAEGAALRWLEALPPPSIAASDAEKRAAVTSYVPVNGVRMGRKMPQGANFAKLKGAGLALLPEHRPRQERGFPVVIPHDPTVYLIWPDIAPGEHRASLEQLTAKVTHVGHSASLVQVWIDDQPPLPNWLPTEGVAMFRLRVPRSGRLDELNRLCNRKAMLSYADMTAELATLKGKAKTRMKEAIHERFGGDVPRSLRPTLGGWRGYARATETTEPAVRGSTFNPDLVVLTVLGKRLSLPATLKLTEVLRRALMSVCPVQPPPEWFSGHSPTGTPSVQPHLALLPLPFVGSEHADGRILGLALALPRDLPPDEAGSCLADFLYEQETGLPRTTRLFAGKWLECRVEREVREKPPASLTPWSWTRRSRIWATVTPVALDRHFDGKDKWERAAESVKDACERIGLPRPREVMLHPVSLVEGVSHAREFPYLIRKSDGGRRHHSHAVLIFDEPVAGPVIIGAGRFRGYGLCRPMDQGGEGHG